MDQPDLGDHPDARDMLALQNGDDRALNRLMDRWQTPLIRYLHRSTGNQADAIDLAQETFVRLHQSRHRYRANGPFSTWLYTIATNLSRNLARWKARHPNDSLDHCATPPPDPASDPSEHLRKKDTARLVQAAIHSLPEDQRTTVLLAEYEDLSHREIAEIMGGSAKGSEARLHRARETLRRTLVKLKS